MAFLIDDILLNPIIWVAKQVQKRVEEERTDEGKIQEELMELQLLYEMEEITKEEYKEKETEIMQRLEAIRKYKEEKEGSERGVLK